jgi:hypothetical protein
LYVPRSSSKVKRELVVESAPMSVKNDAGAWFLFLLILAFYAACALVGIAAVVWAWHYLFG